MTGIPSNGGLIRNTPKALSDQLCNAFYTPSRGDTAGLLGSKDSERACLVESPMLRSDMTISLHSRLWTKNVGCLSEIVPAWWSQRTWRCVPRPREAGGGADPPEMCGSGEWHSSPDGLPPIPDLTRHQQRKVHDPCRCAPGTLGP